MNELRAHSLTNKSGAIDFVINKRGWRSAIYVCSLVEILKGMLTNDVN